MILWKLRHCIRSTTRWESEWFETEAAAEKVREQLGPPNAHPVEKVYMPTDKKSAVVASLNRNTA